MKAGKKLVCIIAFLMFTSLVFFAKPASSQTPQAPLQTIVINEDGTVSPDTVPIHRSGNTYTFTDDIYAAIKIFRSDIVLNGEGHTLRGPYNGTTGDLWIIGSGPANDTVQITKYVTGVDINSRSAGGITIENLNVINFSIGMYIWTQNDTVIRNNISDNMVGLLVSGSNITINNNYIANNTRGLFFGFTTGAIPNDIYIYNNDFEKNNIQMNGCTCKELNSSEPIHNWDFGKIGNYWSDYNGTGNTPYIIDPLNQDRYPLMQSPVKLPIPTPTAVSPKTASPSVAVIALGVSVPAVLAGTLLAVVRSRKKKSVER